MTAGQPLVSTYPARWGKLASIFTARPAAWEFRRPWQAIALGLVITLGQIGLACFLSGEANFRDAYLRLFAWDGHWYGHIAENGYQQAAHMYPLKKFFMKIGRHGDLPFGNVAFFPAYPILGRVLHNGLGLRTENALLLTSQLGCWGLWTYLLLFFQRWRVSPGLAAFGILAILIHPASIYLIASYSEPLFLMALVGFLYWSDRYSQFDSLLTRGGGSGWWGSLASLHGFLMTATRLVGLPLVIYPLAQALLNKQLLGDGAGWRKLKRPLGLMLMTCISSLGSILFFVYCQWRFGQWDLYMKTEEVGWQVHPNYWGIFSPKIFSLHWPKFGLFDPIFLSRLCVPVLVLLFLGLIGYEWKQARSHPDSGWRQRAGFYACGWLMFYICVSGHYSRGMSSMVRFALCPQVLLVLAIVHLVSRTGVPSILQSRRVIFWLIICGLFSLAHQLGFTYQYTHGGWVA